MSSQAYEGGANGSKEQVSKVPPDADTAARQAWLRDRWEERQVGEAKRFRDSLIEW